MTEHPNMTGTGQMIRGTTRLDEVDGKFVDATIARLAMMTPRLAQMTLAAIAATYFEPFRQRDAALGCLAANIDSFLKVFDGDKGHPGTPLQ